VAGCGGARPADSDKDARAVTHLFGQKASLIFVGANDGLITHGFRCHYLHRVFH